MLRVIMWSLTAICATIAIGLLIILSLRIRKQNGNSIEQAYLDEKQRYIDKAVDEAEDNANEAPTKDLPTAVIASDVDRDDWVLRLTNYVFQERHHGRLNVVVINKHLEYHFHVEGVVERHHVKYLEQPRSCMVPFEVVVFKKGVLYNMGDGGDINWDWQGNFIRNGTKMLTFEPCVPGVRYKQDPWVAT